MAYTRLHTLWLNDLVGGTKLNKDAIQHFEDAFVNQDTRIAVIEALSQAKGDLIVTSSLGVFNRLPIGTTTGQVLTVNPGAPLGADWETSPSGYNLIRDEGTNLVARTILNFTGAGVTATDDGAIATTINIPGGSGSASSPFTVRAATTTLNGTNTIGPQTVDGIACVAGDRVFYKDSSTATFNGIYIVGATGVSWTRSADMASGATITAGSLLSVTEGAVNGGRVFQLASTTPGATSVVVGTNPFVVTALNAPAGYATPSPNVVNGQPIYLLGASGNYFVNITVSNTIISVPDGIGNVESVVNVAIQMDSIGGKRYDFTPSSIAWDTGFTPSNDGRPTQFDLTPNMITFMRLTWMGTAHGYYGEVITSIPPLYVNPSTTLSITNTTTAFGGVNPQPLNSNVFFMRYVPASSQQFYYNALTQCFSAALRQRLLNNGLAFEVGAQVPTDGIRAATFRGGSEPNTGFFVNTALGYTASVQQGTTQASASGACIHEMCHALDSLYYGGSNSHPAGTIGNGSEPDQISSHSTLVTLHTDCVNNGASPPAGAQSPANQFEWFAELLRSIRLGDNGAIDGSVTITGGAPNSVEWQIGYGTNLGPGGTGGTPAARLTRFQNYITSLGLV